MRHEVVVDGLRLVRHQPVIVSIHHHACCQTGGMAPLIARRLSMRIHLPGRKRMMASYGGPRADGRSIIPLRAMTLYASTVTGEKGGDAPEAVSQVWEAIGIHAGACGCAPTREEDMMFGG